MPTPRNDYCADAARAQVAEGACERAALAASRDADVAVLRRKMRGMAAEFADMLSETLRRMGEKIEVPGADAGGAVPGAAWDGGGGGGGDTTVSGAAASMLRKMQVADARGAL